MRKTATSIAENSQQGTKSKPAEVAVKGTPRGVRTSRSSDTWSVGEGPATPGSSEPRRRDSPVNSTVASAVIERRKASSASDQLALRRTTSLTTTTPNDRKPRQPRVAQSMVASPGEAGRRAESPAAQPKASRPPQRTITPPLDLTQLSRTASKARTSRSDAGNKAAASAADKPLRDMVERGRMQENTPPGRYSGSQTARLPLRPNSTHLSPPRRTTTPPRISSRYPASSFSEASTSPKSKRESAPAKPWSGSTRVVAPRPQPGRRVPHIPLDAPVLLKSSSMPTYGQPEDAVDDVRAARSSSEGFAKWMATVQAVGVVDEALRMTPRQARTSSGSYAQLLRTASESPTAAGALLQLRRSFSSPRDSLAAGALSARTSLDGVPQTPQPAPPTVPPPPTAAQPAPPKGAAEAEFQLRLQQLQDSAAALLQQGSACRAAELVNAAVGPSRSFSADDEEGAEPSCGENSRAGGPAGQEAVPWHAALRRKLLQGSAAVAVAALLLIQGRQAGQRVRGAEAGETRRIIQAKQLHGAFVEIDKAARLILVTTQSTPEEMALLRKHQDLLGKSRG